MSLHLLKNLLPLCVHNIVPFVALAPLTVAVPF